MVGDKHLLNRIHELSNLKAHIFGHIHYSAGQKYQQLAKSNPIFVNAAICDERYMPVNPIQVVEI
jgi:Icc-related predicted phosphoesterase